MTSSEKFCLKWNDFHQNMANSYKDLRSDKDFTDVTLVCDDNQQIEAHKFILSACSPFFSSLFRRRYEQGGGAEPAQGSRGPKKAW